jgi:asparaginyl-tRNA synthetase
VYTFGPSFRAENSNTSRHLAEFWMLEPEVAFAGLDEAIALASDCVRHCAQTVLERGAEDLERFFARHVDPTVSERVRLLAERPIQRITYTDAVRALQAEPLAPRMPSGAAVAWGDDLGSEQERFLVEHVFAGSPVAVTHYPAALKAFYIRQHSPPSSSSSSSTPAPGVECFDLLVPRIGELVGGSAREERLPLLRDAMVAKGMLRPDEPEEASPLAWYLDLRRFGSVPHAGWGLGFERLVMLLSGIDNIRDAILVPRTPGSCRM